MLSRLPLISETGMSVREVNIKMSQSLLSESSLPAFYVSLHRTEDTEEIGISDTN